MWVLRKHVLYIFVVYITFNLLLLPSSVRSSVVYDIQVTIQFVVVLLFWIWLFCPIVFYIRDVEFFLFGIFFSQKFLYKIKVMKDLHKVFSVPSYRIYTCNYIQNRNSATNWPLGCNLFPRQKKKFPGIVVEIWSQLGGQYRKWVVNSSRV